ncbi:MAG: MlaD family protein [Campylobacterales bacterium]
MKKHDAVKKRRSSLYMLWIIPIIALGVAVTSLYKHFESKGTDIVVTLDSADGFKVNTTPLKFKGMDIGKITHIDVNKDDIEKVDVTITVNKDIADIIAKEGSKFWKVEPNVSLSGISGLGTLLSGNYIACMTNAKSFNDIKSQPSKTNFEALKDPPIDTSSVGKLVNLHSDYGELSLGTPVLFNDFVVGRVVDQDLVDKKIIYKISIDKKYASLLKENSKFWRKSALDLKASLKGVELKVASLQSAISGGIEFTSPQDSQEATSGSDFILYNEKKDTTLSEKTVLIYADNGYNLKENSSVYFSGVEAGMIKSIEHDRKNNRVAIEISLYEMYKNEVNKSSYFWVVEPKMGLSELEDLSSIFEGSYISFVTKESGLEWRSSFDLHKKAPVPQGYEITLKPTGETSLKEGSGIYYNAHKVGEIYDIRFSKQKGTRVIKGVIYKKYKGLVDDSSLFYLSSGVVFDASLEGVYVQSGTLDEMIRGGVGFVTPKTENLSKNEFKLYSDYREFKKAKYLSQDGEVYTLSADSAKDISKGMPLFYKDFKAGEVVDFFYNPKSDSVDVSVFVNSKYAKNIDSSSRFYTISGFKMDASLEGVKVETSPLKAMIEGGIAFENPKEGRRVDKKHRFTLYDSAKKSTPKGVAISLYTDKKNGIKKGSSILYRGIKVGKVHSVSLEGKRVALRAYLDSSYEDLLKYDSVFYLDEFSLGLDGVKNVDSVISGSSISIIPGNSKVKNYAFEISKKTPSMTLYEDGLRVLLKADRKSSLDIGSPLYYRQVRIGEIEDLRLSRDSRSVEFIVYIDECYAELIRQNSRFYQAGGIGFDIDLFGVKVETETVETLLKGGIVLATPTKLGQKAKNKTSYKLYNNPKDEWLEWQPQIERLVPECN